jgi:hypothetical protein
MEKAKQVNFNSLLTTLVVLMVSVIGFFCKHELESIEVNQKALAAIIMPRQEITIELEMIKHDYLRLAAENLDVRTRVSKMEIDLARLQKP